jgi:hypothetical protein
MTSQKALTVTEASEIGGAIHDLMQLNTKALVEKDDASRKRALTSFLQDKMVLHSQEFLAAWFTMKQEYEPLLSAQATMLGNVILIIQRRQQIMEARAQQQEPEPVTAADTAPDATPDNVVQVQFVPKE